MPKFPFGTPYIRNCATQLEAYAERIEKLKLPLSPEPLREIAEVIRYLVDQMPPETTDNVLTGSLRGQEDVY